MKRIVIILCLSFLWHTVDAKCTNSGIWLTGDVKNINNNSVILLEFYSSSQSVAVSLNKKYPIYLKSGNEKIMLLVVETMQGGYNITQVVLKPSTVLTIGSTYELFIDNLEKHHAKPEVYNETLRKRTAIAITITNSSIANNHTILSNATIIKKTMVQYGCGPAKWVYFNLATSEQSTGFVKAFLKDLTTGITTEYIISLENGVAKIGHGMCAGAFSFTTDSKHEISFASFDIAGNYGQKTSSILFDPPTVSTETE